MPSKYARGNIRSEGRLENGLQAFLTIGMEALESGSVSDQIEGVAEKSSQLTLWMKASVKIVDICVDLSEVKSCG